MEGIVYITSSSELQHGHRGLVLPTTKVQHEERGAKERPKERSDLEGVPCSSVDSG